VDAPLLNLFNAGIDRYLVCQGIKAAGSRWESIELKPMMILNGGAVLADGMVFCSHFLLSNKHYG